jgi:hypothetical protein
MSTVLDRKFECFTPFLWVFDITDDVLVGTSIQAKFDSAAVTKKKTKLTLFDKILIATTLRYTTLYITAMLRNRTVTIYYGSGSGTGSVSRP